MSTNEPTLPPRAGIALLTLQLRAALQEATEAESPAALDHGAARDQLRARLDPLVDERRRALDRALIDAQADADAKVAAAHRAATVMLAQAAKRAAAAPPKPAVVAAAVEPTASPAAALYDEEAVTAAVDAPAAVTPVEELATDEATVEELAIDEAPAEESPVADAAPCVADLEWPITQVIPTFSATVTAPLNDAMHEVPVAAAADTAEAPADVRSASSASPPPPQTNSTSITANVVIDAEAFASVFATVFASMLDERLSVLGSGVAPWHGYAPAPVAPAPVKQSFWTHARHTDVLLLTFAMVIALVILAAWLA